MDIDALAKVIAENLPDPYAQTDCWNGPNNQFDLESAAGSDTAQQWRKLAQAVLNAIGQ